MDGHTTQNRTPILAPASYVLCVCPAGKNVAHFNYLREFDVSIFTVHILLIISILIAEFLVNIVRTYNIMEYGSTPMAAEKNGCYIACVQSNMFKTLP